MCDVSYKNHFTFNGTLLGKNNFLSTRQHQHSDTNFYLLTNTQTQTQAQAKPAVLVKPFHSLSAHLDAQSQNVTAVNITTLPHKVHLKGTNC
jgi:hypothetical protein